jgi:HK97 family phage portal protein
MTEHVGDLTVERAVTDTNMSMTSLVKWLNTVYGFSDVRQALRQAAFLICCDVIAQDLAKVPLRLRERLKNGTSRVVDPGSHPIAEMLADEPNRRHTWGEFHEMMGLWHALTSNSYALVRRNGFGDAVALIPLQSGQVQVRTFEADLFYQVTTGTLQEAALVGGSSVVVPERDMIHVRGRMLDGLSGYSTVSVGQDVLETGRKLGEFRGKLFSGEGQVRGVFTADKDAGILPDEAFMRLRQQLGELMRRFKEYSDPIVLEGGLKFEPIASKPSDIELAKQLEAQIVETCRLLRVPPFKAFAMDGAKYENLETMVKMYVGDTMIPICRRHEDRFAKHLLSRKDRMRFFFEFDREALVIQDTKAETERVTKLAERGIITRNEARARMGYQPEAGGDTFTIPVNAMVVDQSNNVVVSAAQDAAKSQAEYAPEPEPATPTSEDA